MMAANVTLSDNDDIGDQTDLECIELASGDFKTKEERRDRWQLVANMAH